jgi:hypothetical protein
MFVRLVYGAANGVLLVATIVGASAATMPAISSGGTLFVAESYPGRVLMYPAGVANLAPIGTISNTNSPSTIVPPSCTLRAAISPTVFRSTTIRAGRFSIRSQPASLRRTIRKGSLLLRRSTRTRASDRSRLRGGHSARIRGAS